MAPTDRHNRHAAFDLPPSPPETEPPREGNDDSGVQDKTLTATPDEDLPAAGPSESAQPQADDVGNTPSAPSNDNEKAESESETEPKTFDKIEITEEDCYDQLGFSFPEWKKWMILTVIFLVQLSMNFNTSLYSNGLDGISEEFNVSAQAARCGAMIFLVLYAFGCELWAPWSEELGRWPILQISLTLVNFWQLPVAIAPNFASIMVGRALGGLSSAGGSVTLGMIGGLRPFRPISPC